MGRITRLFIFGTTSSRMFLWAGVVFFTIAFALLIVADHLKPTADDGERLVRFVMTVKENLEAPIVDGERFARISELIQRRVLSPNFLGFLLDQDKFALNSSLDNFVPQNTNSSIIASPKLVIPTHIQRPKKKLTLSEQRQLWNLFENEVNRYAREERIASILSLCGYLSLLIGAGSTLWCFLSQTGKQGLVEEINLPQLQTNSLVGAIVRAQLGKADRLRLAANHMIALIFLIAIGGMALFYFSGEFSYETRASNNGLLGQTLENLASRNDEAQGRVSDMFSDALNEVSTGDEEPQVKVALLQAAASHAAQLGEFTKADQSTRQLEIALNQNILISSIAARIGIVFIVGFLIKILLASYRYNIRLAAFYSSRAYALMLLPVDAYPKNLAELVSSLGPESLKFEKIDVSEAVLKASELRKAGEP